LYATELIRSTGVQRQLRDWRLSVWVSIKMTTPLGVRTDCRFFVGEKPCIFKRMCNGCKRYAPRGKRILVIKLAAVGDVLRTTSLLEGLKAKYPSSFITWLTDPESAELLRFSRPIDVLLPYSLESIVRLMAERPDIVICLDKEPRATALASQIDAEEKYGFAWSPEGVLMPENELANYVFRLGYDDELKFRRNEKTYQEMIFEVCGLAYERSYEYALDLPEGVSRKARTFINELGVERNDVVVGLNTGAGAVFATKVWPEEHFVVLAGHLRQRLGVVPMLLGGPLEVERNKRIAEECRGVAIDAGCGHSLTDFAGLVACCDLVVSADTLAMHLAMAAQRPVVVLMGPTCAAEIELYGRGTKISADVPCAPCYRQTCDEGHVCMKGISPEDVFDAVSEQLQTGA